MKTIVISGDHSNVGKTTLRLELQQLFENACCVKLGTGTPTEKGLRLLSPDTPADMVLKAGGDAGYLLIESNRILDKLQPDLAIFLPGTDEPKPSAASARQKADLIRGTKVACCTARKLAQQLGISTRLFGRILDTAGVKLTACEFGVF